MFSFALVIRSSCDLRGQRGNLRDQAVLPVQYDHSDPIPTSLINTCTSLYVDVVMPRIMTRASCTRDVRETQSVAFFISSWRTTQSSKKVHHFQCTPPQRSPPPIPHLLPNLTNRMPAVYTWHSIGESANTRCRLALSMVQIVDISGCNNSHLA